MKGVAYKNGMKKDEYLSKNDDDILCDELSFRGLLAKKWDCTNLNFSQMGSSNDRQFRKATTYFKRKPNERVIRDKFSPRRKRKATREATAVAHAGEKKRKQKAESKKRAGPTRYVDGHAHAPRTDQALAQRIAVSTATIDRVVGGRYEWRDGSYRREES